MVVNSADRWSIQIHQGPSKSTWWSYTRAMWQPATVQSVETFYCSVHITIKMHILQHSDESHWNNEICLKKNRRNNNFMYFQSLDITRTKHRVINFNKWHCCNAAASCAIFCLPAFPGYLYMAVRDKRKKSDVSPLIRFGCNLLSND